MGTRVCIGLSFTAKLSLEKTKQLVGNDGLKPSSFPIVSGDLAVNQRTKVPAFSTRGTRTGCILFG